MKKLIFGILLLVVLAMSTPLFAGPLAASPSNCSSYVRPVVEVKQVNGTPTNVYVGTYTYSYSMKYY